MRLIPRRVVYVCARYQCLRLERIREDFLSNGGAKNLLGFPKLTLDTCSFFLLPNTTIWFGKWWRRNQIKNLKIERFNRISISIKPEERTEAAKKSVIA